MQYIKVGGFEYIQLKIFEMEIGVSNQNCICQQKGCYSPQKYMFCIKVGVLLQAVNANTLHPSQNCVCIYLKDTKLERKFYSNLNFQVRLRMNFMPMCKYSSQKIQNQQFQCIFAVLHQVKIFLSLYHSSYSCVCGKANKSRNNAV